MDEQGRIFLVSYDQFDDDYPEEEGIVRMDMPLAAYLFSPKKDDPTKCNIEMVI